MSSKFIMSGAKLFFNCTCTLWICKDSWQEMLKLEAEISSEMSVDSSGTWAKLKNALKVLCHYKIMLDFSLFHYRFRRAMFAMFKCQTHQAMPVTSILPMDVSQSPLASGRIWNKTKAYSLKHFILCFCNALIFLKM
jgi:hypothetical protein